MLRTFLKIGIRNLFKYKLQNGINIIGLATGLAVVMCIVIFLQNELSYDSFHEKNDSLYRIGIKSFREGTKFDDTYIFSPPIGPAMKSELAGIKNYTRYNTPREVFLSTSEKSLKINQVIYADSTFFSLFSFPILAGNPELALASPYSLVLTKSLAERMFDSQEVIGNTVSLDNGSDLQVSAVVADPPSNSHIQFQALISFSTLYQDPRNYLDWNGGQQYITYVELEENSRLSDVEQQLPDFMWRHINEEYASSNLRVDVSFQPMKSIHLNHNLYSSSLRTNLYVMGGMAMLILVIACINFINITVAWAGKRAKEVGVRKVVGASRASLSLQFLSEAFLLTGISFILAVVLVETALPLLPRLFGKPISVPEFFNWTTGGGIICLLLFVWICVGLYPAFHFASFNALKTIKGQYLGRRKSGFRNGLVTFQFLVSIILIISTLVISQQLNFTKTKSLGFDQESILIVPLVGTSVQSKVKALKTNLQNSPDIVAATACSNSPGKGFAQNGYTPEGVENPMYIRVVDVDDDYFKTFDLQLLEGRTLSIEKPGDRNAFVINETLAKLLDWKQALGKKIKRNEEHEVVGVVKDFHFASLHESIEPLIITCAPWQGNFNYLAIKLATGDLQQGIQTIRQTWQHVLPGTPMDFWFLDDALNQIYHSEERLQEAFLWCSGLSIFIALMGIFGLTSFSVQQRRKEIGIRKVLGASVSGIVGLLSKDFLILVLAALIIGSPLAYYFMDKWLQNFVYRIDIPWWVFAFSGMIALFAAFVTVSLLSFRAAISNPVDAIQHE